MNKDNIERIYPLSPLQQGMHFHHLYDPESEVYFVQINWLFNSRINVSEYQRAWQQVMDRHPVLRTLFLWKSRGEPMQVVRRHVDLPWEEHDWSNQTPEEQRESLKTLCETDRKRGFDFSKAPLMRLTLVRTSENTSRFIWSFHHILLDGWSVQPILKEVNQIYLAYCSGREFNLPKPRPYHEYIAWLKKQNLSKAETYWQQRLKGFIKPTKIDGDGVSTTMPYKGQARHEQHIQLSEETTEALQRLIRQHQLTLNTLLQGLWALLLSRYSGEQDVVFGVTVSGRPPDLEGVESMVGNFINALPMRVKMSPEQPLLDWLKNIRDQQAEMRDYEYSPLVQVQSWSEIPRGISLFESITVFENYPIDTLHGDDSSDREQRGVSDFHFLSQTDYPLHLRARPGTRLTLDLIYDGRRFTSEMIGQMLEQIQTLFDQIGMNPEWRISDLSLLSETRRQELANRSNLVAPTNAFEYFTGEAIEQTIVARFEQQARCNPDQIALKIPGRQMTYAQLNQAADRIAQAILRRLGEGEQRVGLLFNHGVSSVVGILGALKAGKTYVPLDPAYPERRLTYILEDSQAAALVTNNLSAALAAELAGEQTVLINIDQIDEEEIVAGVESEITPDSLAYILASLKKSVGNFGLG